MNTADIVQAITNVVAIYPEGIVGETVVLNRFRLMKSWMEETAE
jgi:hypothetical protein